MKLLKLNAFSVQAIIGIMTVYLHKRFLALAEGSSSQRSQNHAVLKAYKDFCENAKVSYLRKGWMYKYACKCVQGMALVLWALTFVWQESCISKTWYKNLSTIVNSHKLSRLEFQCLAEGRLFLEPAWSPRNIDRVGGTCRSSTRLTCTSHLHNARGHRAYKSIMEFLPLPSIHRNAHGPYLKSDSHDKYWWYRRIDPYYNNRCIIRDTWF